MLGPNGAGKTSTVESARGLPPAGRPARSACSGSTRRRPRGLTGRMGVMLQRGGVYPMLGPRRALDLFAGYYPDPMPTDELLDLVGLRAVAATPVAPPLGRRAAAAVAGPGPDRPARGGLPRRADRRRRPRGPPGHPRRGGRAEGRGRVRAPHHPRAGRGRAAGRPHRDLSGRPGGGSRARPHRAGRRRPMDRPRSRHLRRPAGARHGIAGCGGRPGASR